ncbi:MAG: hypothetical protein HYR56_26920 [Acidobacteria bacterium]|nr:hypothetical protein [Acidobacteriota bacterium]MBI3423043.1 hypothetical protein [Acidobacteriota bacterium]
MGVAVTLQTTQVFDSPESIFRLSVHRASKRAVLANGREPRLPTTRNEGHEEEEEESRKLRLNLAVSSISFMCFVTSW